MNAPDLAHIAPGFADASLGSQAVFRAALQALSHPGRPINVDCDMHTPQGTQPAATAFLLALLDADCTVWLSPRHAQAVGPWLRFHTGCSVVDAPEVADFVWVAQGDAMPPLASLALGSDVYPDRSATCVLEAAALHAENSACAWTLRGPGIASTAHLSVAGLADDFAAQWGRNHTHFPRGVDVVFASGTQLVGLPRTTILTNAEGG